MNLGSGKKCVLPATLAAAVLLGIGCARDPGSGGNLVGPDAGTAKAGSGAVAPVTLQLNYSLNGQHTPFFVALDQGLYRRHGLEVTVREGRGSLAAVQLAARDEVDFAYADATTAARAIAEKMPVSVVAAYVQRTPMAVIAKANNGIQTPQDLVGKRIAVIHGDALTPIFPALMRKNGLDAEAVSLVGVGTPLAKEAALMEGEVDGFLGFTFAQKPMLERKHGIEISALEFSDWGIVQLGPGIVASPGALADPDLIRRFLAATQEGWRYTLAHPEEAAEIFARYGAGAGYDKDLALTELQLLVPLLHTPRSEGKPVGWMAEEDWMDTLSVLRDYAGFQGALQPDLYYTNAFLPNGA